MTTIIPPAYVTESEELYDQSVNPQNTKRLVAFIRPYIGRLILSAALMLIASAASVAGPMLCRRSPLIVAWMLARPCLLRYTLLAFLGVLVIQWVGTYYEFESTLCPGSGSPSSMTCARCFFAHLQDLSLGFYSRYSVGRVDYAGYQRCGDPAGLHDLGVAGHRPDVFTWLLIIVVMPSMDVRWHCSLSASAGHGTRSPSFRSLSGAGYRKVRAADPRVTRYWPRTSTACASSRLSGRSRTTHISGTMLTATILNRCHGHGADLFCFQPQRGSPRGNCHRPVIWLGGTAVLGERITAGVLVAFILYIDRFFDPIRDLSRRYDALQSTMIGWERIMGLLDIPVEVQDAQNAGELPSLQGEVRLEHVSFHYSDDPAPILTDIDLHIRPGKTVALVGKTGAGKTTLVKLLSRFHDPTSGCIRADGYDLRTVTQASLRKQMGVVLQDPFLFNGTVRENIRFGRLDATDAEVEAAAQAVGAHDFIIHLRNGYETSVEEGGVMLSVGQRQLLSFARALLADPRILILDEATSSVDTQTEQIIQAALRRLLKGRTSFVIAHRLSTITNADRIVVVHDGKIIEQGTHAELLEKQGMYYNLYRTGFQE